MLSWFSCEVNNEYHARDNLHACGGNGASRENEMLMMLSTMFIMGGYRSARLSLFAVAIAAERRKGIATVQSGRETTVLNATKVANKGIISLESTVIEVLVATAEYVVPEG